ncbi:MAG: TlpA disulfide reductase family protein [Chloroflexota bacterium]
MAQQTEPAPVSGPPAAPEGRPHAAARALLWSMVAVMAAAWFFLAGGRETLQGLIAPAPSAPTRSADVGQPAPDLHLKLAGSGDVDLARYRGRVVLLNFWATWCTPCKAEMPAIDRIYRAKQASGFEVLGVNLQESEDQVLGFLKEVQVSFPSLLDPTMEVARRYRATALPTTFIIDREGIIRYVRVGPLTDEMLEEQLAKIL